MPFWVSHRNQFVSLVLLALLVVMVVCCSSSSANAEEPSFALLNIEATKETALSDDKLSVSNEPVAEQKRYPKPEPLLLTPEEPVQLRAYLQKNQALPLDLKTVIELVEQQNLSIADKRLEVEVAKSSAGLAIADLLPDVLLSYDQNRFQGGIQVFGGNTVDIFRTTYQPQVALTWTVHPFGRDIATAFAAKKGAESLEAGLEATHQEQLANAVTQYYSLLESDLNLAVAQKTVELAQRQLTLDKARHKAGVAPKLDVMRSQALLATREQSRLDAETERLTAEQTLLEQLNLSPLISVNAQLQEAAKLRLVPPSLDNETLQKRALKAHPTIVERYQAIAGFKAQHRSAKLAILPELQLSTYLNGTGPDIDELALSRFGGFRVEMNVLRGLGTRRYFDIKQKRQEWERAKIQAEQAVQAIQRSTSTAYLSAHQTERQIPLAQDSLLAAEESYRLALGRYRAGVGPQLDVLDAEDELFQARNLVIRSILAYNRSQVSLLEAIGQVSPTTLLQGLPDVSP